MKTCLFVGIDTHKDSHTAAVLDGYFEVVTTIRFDNNSEGFAPALKRNLKSLNLEKNLSSALRTARAWEAFLPVTLSVKAIRHWR